MISEKVFWRYQGDGSPDDRCLFVLVQVFDLVTGLSTKVCSHQELFRTLTIQLIQVKLYSFRVPYLYVLLYLDFLCTV